MVACACNFSYAGGIGKRIMLQASPGKNQETLPDEY
jgi:hypothetical protein